MICMGNEQVYEYEYDYKLDSGLTGTVSADIKKKTVTDVIPDCTLKQLEDEWKDVSKDHGKRCQYCIDVDRIDRYYEKTKTE